MASPQSQRKGLFGGLLTFLLLTSAEGHFLKVRNGPGQKEFVLKKLKKAQSLLSKRTNDPGYFRNYGVRSGIPEEDMGAMGDDGSKQNSALGYNWVTADSMRLDFPFLDNLHPQAPMDRLNQGKNQYGMDATYVSEYQNPDAFPTVKGKGCMCQSPTNPDEQIECDCGKHEHNDHYTWLKDTPVLGTNNYTLTPADITYRAGNYWEPNPRHGLASPADSLPAENYPNQAPGNKIWPLPARAAADRVAVKYARYMDQVHQRSVECDGISKDCTTACAPGDAVLFLSGNSQLPATVVRTFEGNTVEVEFAPNGADGEETTECGIKDVCDAFNYCKGKGQCVSPQDEEHHNWQGMLVTKRSCPHGTKLCKKVPTMTMADQLEKDGKACKATAKDFPAAPK